MKIDFSTSADKTQTELNEKFFTIADPAFVFDLLRNKIYSNPILAICRELSCNALDAHREVGKGEIPIQISIPNNEEPYFKVRDFGPGISPERMDDIYLKYAASTKRDSNDQIGAFGIGAKSPFAYSESFTIVTNYNGKCYNYMAFIDESRMGKLILLSEIETSESNGTEIIVPVKPSDFNNFIENIEKCTRHWKVKPTFASGMVRYKKISPFVYGDNWFITSDRENYYEKRVKIIVGETEYNINNSDLSTFCNTSILSVVNADVYMLFNMGEISLAANRESVYLDNNTKKLIEERMVKIRGEYLQIVRDTINSQPTYWDACSFVENELSKICYDKTILNPITWNGRKVISNFKSNSNFSIFEFYEKKGFGDFSKIYRRSSHAIYPTKKSKIIIHDCGAADPTQRHLKPFFNENDKHFYVICPLNSQSENFDISSFIEEEGLDIFDIELLSKHNRTIKQKKQSEKLKMIVSKMDSSGSFGLTSISEVLADTNTKVFVHLRKDPFRNRKSPISLDKKYIDPYNLCIALNSDKQISIYGVDENFSQSKILEVVKDSVFFDDYINNWFDKVDKQFYYESIWYNSEAESSLSEYKFAKKYAFLKDKIIFSNSAMLNFLNYYTNIYSTLESRKGFMNMLHVLGKTSCKDDPEFEQFCLSKKKEVDSLDKVKLTYPLLEAIDSYYISSYTDQISSYVNLIDKTILT